MSTLLLAFVLVLAVVALAAGIGLFVAKPRERPRDLRAAFVSDARAALQDLLVDPDAAEAREAEARADWPAARVAYARALGRLALEDPGDAAVALKRRALESKLEELRRLEEA